MDKIISAFVGLLAAVIGYGLISFFGPKEIPPDPNATALDAAKLCVLNNIVKGNQNVMTMLDVVTGSVDSLVIKLADQGELFKEIEDCTARLSKEEIDQLIRSREYQMQLKQAQELTNRLIRM